MDWEVDSGFGRSSILKILWSKKVMIISLHLTRTKYCHLNHCLDVQNIYIPQYKTAVQKGSNSEVYIYMCLSNTEMLNRLFCVMLLIPESGLWWSFFPLCGSSRGSRSSQLQLDTQIVEVLSYCGKLSLWKISNIRNLI